MWTLPPGPAPHALPVRVLVLPWLALAALAGLAACHTPEPPAPPPAPPASCEAAAAHQAELGCARAKGSPGGGSFVDVCANALRNGIPYPTGCYATAATCDACH